MADLILPGLLIIGGLIWSFLRILSDSMRSQPRGNGPGFLAVLAIVLGLAWLAHSIWRVL